GASAGDGEEPPAPADEAVRVEAQLLALREAQRPRRLAHEQDHPPLPRQLGDGQRRAAEGEGRALVAEGLVEGEETALRDVEDLGVELDGLEDAALGGRE